MSVFHSSVLQAIAALVALGFLNSSNKNFVHAQQDLAGKWALDNPVTTFVAETNTFTLTYDLDDTIGQSNTLATIFDKDCLEGNNEMTEGITGMALAFPSIGKGTLDFTIDTSILSQRSDVYAVVSPGIGEMKLCARFMLQTDDGSFEVNFIESVITVTFDLTSGFELAAFAVVAKELVETIGDKSYDAEAYLCNTSYPDIRLPSTALTQGGVVSVCVTPSQIAIDDGLFLTSIDSFMWVRGQIEQPAIEDGIEASNSLTQFYCRPGSLVCSFVSILYADFYQPPTPPPSPAPTLFPSPSPSGPGEEPTPYPTSSPSSFPTDMPTLFVSSPDSPEGTLCEEISKTAETNLNFYESIVKKKALDVGEELRYGNIGKVRGEDVDLIVTSTDYQNSNGSGSGKNDGDEDDGKFGIINMNTVQGDQTSGEGTFEFCFVEPDTFTQVTVDSFQWSIFDLDNRGNDANINSGLTAIQEKMTMDTSQALGYSLYPNIEETEVTQKCENDDSQPPCDYGVRTVFEATTIGNGPDNPDDPDDLTELQKARSIVFTFTDTACWTIVFNAYCPVEPSGQCTWYGGSNFLFGGNAQQIISEGETDCSTSPNGQVRNLDATTDKERRNLADNDAEVLGSGSCSLQFGSRRRLAGGRAMQDAGASADIGMSIQVTTLDAGPPGLRTAGGTTFGTANLVSIIGLIIVNALILLV